MKVLILLFLIISFGVKSQTVTDKMVTEAIEMLQNGDVVNARDLLKQAYTNDSENSEALYYLSQTYFELGNLDSSKYFLKRVTATSDIDQNYYLLQGRIDQKQYRYDLAQKAFFESIQVAESNETKAEAFSLMAISKSEMGLPDEASQDIDEALKLDEQAEYYYQRAKFNYQKGKTPKAIRDFDRALNIDETHAGSYFWRGIAKHSQMDYESGCKDLEKAENLHQPNARQMRVRLCQ